MITEEMSMKRGRLACCVALLCLVSVRATSLASDLETRDAELNGAQGRITFHVINSMGEPVQGATLSAGFYMANPQSTRQEHITDSMGIASVAGKSKYDMNYEIEKEGFYPSSGSYRFLQPGATVRNGEWHPWNPTVEVLLNEKRNPVKLIARSASLTIPARDIPLGYDFEIEDWIRPYGKGQSSDIVFTYRTEYQGPQVFKKSLLISFARHSDGLVLMPSRMGSLLWSLHEAPMEGYVDSILLEHERTEDTILKDSDIPKDKHIVFRTGTLLDSEGRVSSVRYGKIYQPIEYWRSGKRDYLKFTYYYNPTGSRNLEHDYTAKSRRIRASLDLEDVTRP